MLPILKTVQAIQATPFYYILLHRHAIEAEKMQAAEPPNSNSCHNDEAVDVRPETS